MDATGWSRRTFYRRSAELISREKPGGLNARALREYLSSSLPRSEPQVQLAVVTPVPSFGPLFAGVPATGVQRVTLPDPDAQAQAEKRLAIIQPLLEYSDNAERLSSLKLPDGRNVTSLSRFIEHIALTSGLCIRTVKQWLALYRSGGFVALADRTRGDKGVSRWFARHRDAAILAAYLYLGDVDTVGLRTSEKPHRGQSVAFVYEQLIERAESLGIAADDLPSRETVRTFLGDAISPAMKALAREGQRQYRERMSPYLRRRYDDVYANSIWVGDQMIHDVEVANDLFDGAPLGAPVRLRMDAFEDYRSRKIVGATWTLHGSSRSIASTLRRAIMQYGPPELIYVDNGKDYRKVAKGAQRGFPKAGVAPEDLTPIERTGFLARIGVGVVHCIPRHPQSKGIERCFGTAHHFDSFFSTYTSGSSATRPDATGTAMAEHRRLFKKGRVAESNHPLASRFIAGCLAWIDKYNATPHSGAGMNGLTPDQVFAAEFNPTQKPVPEPAALALLMSEYKRAKVDSCAVRLNKRRYTPHPDDRNAWGAMHEANERDILVAFDPCDPEYAAALDLDGRFIAWLEAEHLACFAPDDPATQAQIAASMSIRRGLEKATKQSLRVISAMARANGAKSAEDMLYAQLEIPATTGEIVTQSKPRLRPEKKAQAPMTPAAVARMLLEE
jgi:hypothetical protein